jgi:hypothetical protein
VPAPPRLPIPSSVTFRQAQAAAVALAAMVRSPTSGGRRRAQSVIEIVSPSPVVARRAGRVAHSSNVIVNPKAETVIERQSAYGRLSKHLQDEDVLR